MTHVLIKHEDNRILAEVPARHREFREGARKIGGRLSPSGWTFAPLDEQEVRNLCIEIFGTDDTGTADLVTLRVEAMRRLPILDYPLFIAGREIGEWNRDTQEADIAPGVVFLKGDLQGGITNNRNKTETTWGAIFEIRDTPRGAAEEVLAELKRGARYPDFKNVEIIENENPAINTVTRCDVEERLTEIEKRLTEIEKPLQFKIGRLYTTITGEKSICVRVYANKVKMFNYHRDDICEYDLKGDGLFGSDPNQNIVGEW